MSTGDARAKVSASRFQVLYSRPRGSKKQRQWRDGILRVNFDSANLYDAEEHRSVTSQHGFGPMPNKVFQKMKDAHGGMDWVPRIAEHEAACGQKMASERPRGRPSVLTGLPGDGDSGPQRLAEVWIGPNYLVQILEALELHLLPYDRLPPHSECHAAVERSANSDGDAQTSTVSEAANGASMAAKPSVSCRGRRALCEVVPPSNAQGETPLQQRCFNSGPAVSLRPQPLLHAHRPHGGSEGVLHGYERDARVWMRRVSTGEEEDHFVRHQLNDAVTTSAVRSGPPPLPAIGKAAPLGKRARSRESLLKDLQTSYSHFFVP